MNAVIVTEFGSTEVMKFTEMEIPSYSSHQVLIEVHTTSVNFADIKSRYGKKGAGKFPFIPGIDLVGVIKAVGSDVQGFEVGQRVIAFPSGGSYCEYAVAHENLTFPIPETMSFDVAAACPIVSFLSYQLIAMVARIERGETVLIHSAAGGVGTTAIQVAKLLGAGKVIGTVGSEAKIPFALEAGADHVICYEKEDFSEVVNELTNGRGANIILDSVAGRVTEKSMTCLAPFGRLIHFGNSSGEVGNFKTVDLHSSCRSVLGFSFGTTRKERPELLGDVAKKVFNYIGDGSLKIKVGHHYPLSEAAKAHELVENRLSTGKVLLHVK
ncbi:quinone oxidoreductase family protein [Anaerobacillus isosaccharinicus]|uniref:Quinone oxidoreductase n=1 Tax=Anaerobacillus isosaccharinicus TaxID=1532552 RepID=A0A1S2LIQ9_9BACI|nr:NADPH:quinone oxidoreductase family protein [Anaerobacillus isosaccharinicus]MBA5586169.1 NADPH:quinone oxidoreductase family protein [Anaerobacillus isosaccharinicus]QOY35566.1 NADPH:quinone oxidoreductase family protein [Anaerobacillus isosaccharinicus]